MLIFLSSPLDTPSSLAYFSDMFLGRQERTRLRQAFLVAAQCPLAGRSVRPHSFPFFRFRDKWPPFTKHLDYKDLPVDVAYRKVYDFEGGSWQDVGDGAYTTTAFVYHISMSCNHCDNPACAQVCPTGAMHKDPETGLVSVDETK